MHRHNKFSPRWDAALPGNRPANRSWTSEERTEPKTRAKTQSQQSFKHQQTAFFSVHTSPGNRTHDLGDARNIISQRLEICGRVQCPAFLIIERPALGWDGVMDMEIFVWWHVLYCHQRMTYDPLHVTLLNFMDGGNCIKRPLFWVAALFSNKILRDAVAQNLSSQLCFIEWSTSSLRSEETQMWT